MITDRLAVPVKDKKHGDYKKRKLIITWSPLRLSFIYWLYQVPEKIINQTHLEWLLASIAYNKLTRIRKVIASTDFWNGTDFFFVWNILKTNVGSHEETIFIIPKNRNSCTVVCTVSSTRLFCVNVYIVAFVLLNAFVVVYKNFPPIEPLFIVVVKTIIIKNALNNL